MHESPQFPPRDSLTRAQLVRLPLRSDVIMDVQRRAARRGKPLDQLALAHELGDVRFAAAFAPDPDSRIQRPRWQGALSVFSLVDGPRPALLGHTTQSLGGLRAVPLPASWSDDPILWDEAEATSLLVRLERRQGLSVPFSAEFWPGYRMVDPAKAAHGKRRTPRTREVDIARYIQTSQPNLQRPAAYATWLANQLLGVRLDPLEVRIAAEATISSDQASFQTISIRLAGRLVVDDPIALGSALLRGIGRRRAYGLGMVAVA